MPEEIILNTSDEAAQHRTDISGWVSRDGLYFGKDEQTARYAGCTHILCEGCGKVTPKNYTFCLVCRDKKKIEKYNEMEQVEWDGTTPLYSEKLDEYLFDSDLEYLEEFADSHDCTVKDLMLIICDPIRLREIENDYGCDELSWEGELPDEVWEALENFNDTIRSCPPVSWHPGKKVPILPNKKGSTTPLFAGRR